MLRALRPNLTQELNTTWEFQPVLTALQNPFFHVVVSTFSQVLWFQTGGFFPLSITQLQILWDPLPAPFPHGPMARCGGLSLGYWAGSTLDPGRQTLLSQLLESLPPCWTALTQTSWRHCNARKCYSWTAWQIGSTHADLGTVFGGLQSTHCPGTEPLITVYIRQSDTFPLLNDPLFFSASFFSFFFFFLSTLWDPVCICSTFSLLHIQA